MTDKQVAIDLLSQLSEATSLQDIIAELQHIAANRRGRTDLMQSRCKTHAEVEQLLEAWPAGWSMK